MIIGILKNELGGTKAFWFFGEKDSPNGE